jgi:hypothetical protein
MDLPPQNDAFGASIGGMKKADAFFMLVLLFEVADLLQPTKKRALPNGNAPWQKPVLSSP